MLHRKPFLFTYFIYSSLYLLIPKWKWKLFSHVRLFVTSWTIQSKEYSRPKYWSGQPFPFPGDLPNPGIKPRSPTLKTDSLPAEPQGKPKNIGVGSIFLLQQIFLTQELNRGILHCRPILYQLSYLGSPNTYFIFPNLSPLAATSLFSISEYFLFHT